MDTLEKARNIFLEREVAELYLKYELLIVTPYPYIICIVFIEAELFWK